MLCRICVSSNMILFQTDREEGTITEYTSPSKKIASWTEATAMCREQGGTLADLHANNMKAVTALPDHSEFWVGLYRNTSWEWHTGMYL